MSGSVDAVLTIFLQMGEAALEELAVSKGPASIQGRKKLVTRGAERPPTGINGWMYHRGRGPFPDSTVRRPEGLLHPGLFRHEQVLRKGPFLVNPLRFAEEAGVLGNPRNFFRGIFVAALGPDRFPFGKGTVKSLPGES